MIAFPATGEEEERPSVAAISDGERERVLAVFSIAVAVFLILDRQRDEVFTVLPTLEERRQEDFSIFPTVDEGREEDLVIFSTSDKEREEALAVFSALDGKREKAFILFPIWGGPEISSLHGVEISVWE
ncbi:MAG: hypothetical protein ABF955_07255 [Zymomonas mobilis]